MLVILHLSLMIAAVVCLITGIGIAMFGRKKNNWLKFHKKINSTGLIIALAGASAAFANVVSSGGVHLAGLHHRAGLTALILSCITLFLGFYSFKAANKAAVRAAHRWSGRLSLVAMLATLVLGLMMIGIF